MHSPSPQMVKESKNLCQPSELLLGREPQDYSSATRPVLSPSARGIVAGQLDRANGHDRRGTGRPWVA